MFLLRSAQACRLAAQLLAKYNGGRKIMEKKIESLIKEHKIIAILRGVQSEKIVDVAKADI